MKRPIVYAAALLSLFAVPAAAQTRRFEIGVDAAFTSIGEEGEPGLRQIEVPRWLRVGVPIGERLLLEASTTWRRFSSNGASASGFELQPSVAWLWRRADETRPYVALVAGVNRLSDGRGGASQASLGAAVGVRIPLRGGAILRLEAGLEHAFETDRRRAASRLRIGVGMSLGIR